LFRGEMIVFKTLFSEHIPFFSVFIKML
jgi:hypothetical protein